VVPQPVAVGDFYAQGRGDEDAARLPAPRGEQKEKSSLPGCGKKRARNFQAGIPQEKF